MCYKMECKAVVCLCLFVAAVGSSTVSLKHEWKPDIGWEITCSWKLCSNDSLQSVRLYDNERQFMIYRPETDGKKRSEVFRRPENMMLVDCTESIPRGLVGTCVLTMELYQPQVNDFSYSCEVSGEKPMFRIEKQNLVISAFVPPTEAVVELGSAVAESGRVSLNCSSSGMLTPQLSWTIGEQKVPSDFTGSYWNATSKLWHVWSVLSYTQSDEHKATCTPKVARGEETIKGISATYNLAYAIKGTSLVILMFLLLLLR